MLVLSGSCVYLSVYPPVWVLFAGSRISAAAHTTSKGPQQPFIARKPVKCTPSRRAPRRPATSPRVSRTRMHAGPIAASLRSVAAMRGAAVCVAAVPRACRVELADARVPPPRTARPVSKCRLSESISERRRALSPWRGAASSSACRTATVRPRRGCPRTALRRAHATRRQATARRHLPSPMAASSAWSATTR
jgi:hypothetical protein